MKRWLLVAAAALAGAVAVRRVQASRHEADLWHEATREPDLR